MAQRQQTPQRQSPASQWTALQKRQQRPQQQPGRFPNLNVQYPLPLTIDQRRPDSPRPEPAKRLDHDPMQEYINAMVRFNPPPPQTERIYPVLSEEQAGPKSMKHIPRPDEFILDIHQSEKQPMIKINKDYILAPPDRQYWFNCLRCNPRPKCPGNIVPHWDYNTTQEDPYMNVPYLTLKSTPEWPRSPYFPNYFERPPNAHSILAGDMSIALAQFCVNLLGIDFHLNINNFTALGHQYHFARILQFLQCDMLDMGIYATPLELAFQTISGEQVHFAPLHDSFMQHDSPIVGLFCHKFIIPMRVTSYRRWTMSQIAKYDAWKSDQLQRLALFPQDRIPTADSTSLFSLGRRGLPEVSIYDFHNDGDTRYCHPYQDCVHPKAYTVLPQRLPHKINPEGHKPDDWKHQPWTTPGPNRKYVSYMEDISEGYSGQSHQPPQFPYYCTPMSPPALRIDDSAYDRILQDRLIKSDFNAFTFPAFSPMPASAPPPLHGQSELERQAEDTH